MTTATDNRLLRSLRRLARLHRDDSGSISVISVFALIVLVFLMGMVLNSGKQVDQKVKMQNAADAATYSGAVVVGRGMNTLAFTNHLLCDVFALTAFMREARDHNAEDLTPEILDNWARVGPAFRKAELPEYGGYEKFARLGRAISDKVPHERELVRTFGDWAAAASELMLPVFERVLAEQRIPKFQRALVRTTPQMAQIAADEVARRHGRAWPQSTELRGVLWRTNGQVVFDENQQQDRLMPVVDPVVDEVFGREEYARDAVDQRFRLAHTYLRRWNNESLPLFDGYAKMSQFGSLWRIFTGGHLQKLLEEDYPNRNLPCQVKSPPERFEDLNNYLEKNCMLVGVVYRKRMADEMPGIFRNPVATDTQAYAQAMTFVPKRRLIKAWRGPGGTIVSVMPPVTTGVPGQNLGVPPPPPSGAPPPPPGPPQPPPDGDQGEYYSIVVRQRTWKYPDQWTLVDQNWTAQLVPATCRKIPSILSHQPYGAEMTAFDTPDLTAITIDDFQWLSNH